MSRSNKGKGHKSTSTKARRRRAAPQAVEGEATRRASSEAEKRRSVDVHAGDVDFTKSISIAGPTISAKSPFEGIDLTKPISISTMSAKSPLEGIDIAKLAGVTGSMLSAKSPFEGIDLAKPISISTISAKSPLEGIDIAKLAGVTGSTLSAKSPFEGIDLAKPISISTISAKSPLEGIDFARPVSISTISAKPGPSVSRYSLEGIHNQIDEQRHLIDDLRNKSLRESKPLVTVAAPYQPALETNERLERIEKHFEQMKDVLTGGALIANNIQGHAVDFLNKFEKASSDNDRSAANAIKIGRYALIISFFAALIPVLQFFYSEHSSSEEKREMEQEISDLRNDLRSIKEAHDKAADRLTGALGAAGRESSTILKEIKQLLGRDQPRSVLDEAPATQAE